MIALAARAARRGDIIFTDRGLYKHYGVYNNDNSIIHFLPDSGAEISPENAYIRETSLAEFLKGGALCVDRTVRPAFPPDEVARRARQAVGTSRGEYDLMFYNCEHFARWCATGKIESMQVKKGLHMAKSLAETAVALVTKAVLNRNKLKEV